MITLPIKCKLLPNGLVRLYFDHGPSVDHYVRGAIAWSEKGLPGMAIVASQDPVSKKVWIYEDYEFRTIEPVDPGIYQIDPIYYDGLRIFLNRCRERYFCRYYFYRQPQEICREAISQIRKNEMIERDISFIELLYRDTDIMDNILETYKAHMRLQFGKQSKLFQHVATKDPERFQGYHAMRCLVAGYEYYPYRDYTTPKQEIEYLLR
jgi:hypothetical protein